MNPFTRIAFSILMFAAKRATRADTSDRDLIHGRYSEAILRSRARPSSFARENDASAITVRDLIFRPAILFSDPLRASFYYRAFGKVIAYGLEMISSRRLSVWSLGVYYSE